MKKLSAILLLISFSFQITGYHLVFYFMRQDIKRSVREMIKDEVNGKNTLLFVFSLAGAKGDEMPEWEGDDEFRLNGEMYDVIGKKREKGKLYVRCISDKKETELVNNYKDIAGKDFGGSSKKRTALLSKLGNVFYATVCDPGPAICIYSGKTDWLNYEYPLSLSTIEVLTPPPKFV